MTKHVFITSATGSPSSSESNNQDRSIASTSEESRQTSSQRADLVFIYLSNGLACVEIGLEDHGPKGTKELNEREVKLPKMLKGFYSRLVSRYSHRFHNFKAIGIVISGKGSTLKRRCTGIIDVGLHKE